MVHLSRGEVLARQLHAVHVHHQALAREHGQLQEGRVACRLHLRAEVHRGQSRGNRPPLAGGTQRPGAVVELGVAPGGGRRERREEEAKRGCVVDEEKVVQRVLLQTLARVQAEGAPEVVSVVRDEKVAAGDPADARLALHTQREVAVGHAEHVGVGPDLEGEAVERLSTAQHGQRLAEERVPSAELNQRGVLWAVVHVHREEQHALALLVRRAQLEGEDTRSSEAALQTQSGLVEGERGWQHRLEDHTVVGVLHGEAHAHRRVGLRVNDGRLRGDDGSGGVVERQRRVDLLPLQQLEVGQNQVVLARDAQTAVDAGALAERVQAVGGDGQAEHERVERFVHDFVDDDLARLGEDRHLHHRAGVHGTVHQVVVVARHHVQRERRGHGPTVVGAGHPEGEALQLLHHVALDAPLLGEEHQALGQVARHRPREHGHVRRQR